MKEELIKRLKQLDVIYKEPVKLKGGSTSEFYVDIKKAYGYPDVLNLICENIWNQIDKRTTCVAASGHGGLSLATLLS